MLERQPMLEGARWVVVAMTPGDAPLLQQFLDANPLYAELAYGRPWSESAGQEELTDRPPEDWPQGESRYWAALERGSGRVLGILMFVEDLLATGVWHMGLFLVATREHGSGLAHELHEAWSEHAARHGARWLRLGVILANERAVAFWRRLGYVEVRQRHGVNYGLLTHSLGVCVRCLGNAGVAEYLARVPRDQPDAG